MGYSPEVLAKVCEIYENRKEKTYADLEARISQATAAIPALEPIEKVLGSTGVRIMEAIKKKDGGKALEEVRRENEELVEKRRAILVSNGFPADQCEPRYICAKCEDTGYIGSKKCDCMKAALYKAQAEISGLGVLLPKQRFDNFDVKYYDDKENAQNVLDFCKDFAKKRVANGENLILMGATGLGKTHLSTAIADTVMKNGGSVIYESAPNILADFQYEQFGRGYSDKTPVRTDKYFGADLLIIDDLGSEMTNQFTVSVIYNLINTRLNNRLSVLISTNLSAELLLRQYDRRITSRIFESYTLCTLEGKDIRMQRLSER